MSSDEIERSNGSDINRRDVDEIEYDEVDSGDDIRRNGGMVLVRRQEISGPLPPPQILREYESIVPGSADRIIRMAENARADYESVRSGELAITKTLIGHHNTHEILRILIGGVLILAGVGLSGGLFYRGELVAGCVIFCAVLFTVAGTVITGRERERKFKVNAKNGELEYSQSGEEEEKLEE